MKSTAPVRSLALAALTLLATCEVSAVALTGGAVSLVGGSGSCNKSQVIPLNTPQDTFALAVSTACKGGSASGELHSDASTASVGLHTAVSGIGAQAAAEVSLIDQWMIGVPVGTAPGSVFTLPAAFRLEGDIATGSTFGASFGRFLDYSISLGQLGSLSGILQRSGQVASTGHFDGVEIHRFEVESIRDHQLDVRLPAGRRNCRSTTQRWAGPRDSSWPIGTREPRSSQRKTTCRA